MFLNNHDDPRRTALVRILLALAGMAFLAGCGTKQIAPSGTEADAQKLVTTTLEAWKSGQKPDQLKSATPAVHVADEDWQAGKSLKAFQLPEPPVKHGGEWRVYTTLTLSANGQPDVQKKVAYSVTTAPAVTILRADDVIQ